MAATGSGGTAEEGVIRLPPHLREWIEEVTGAEVTYADRQPGGGRKEAWFVDVQRSGEREALFLRWDRSDPAATGDPWTVHREARVYAALQDTEVRVATLFAVHPHDQALLAERLVGENWFSQLRDEVARVAVATDFMDQLAALHLLDPAALDIEGLDASRSLRELALDQVTELEEIVAFRGGIPDPILAMALRYLREHVPEVSGRVSLIQGDTGPGNFMYADGRVVAVVDWELAHLGDPMDDLAWVTLRSVQEDFGDLRALFARYSKATGNVVDPARIRYYRLLAEAKILTMNHRGEVAEGEETDEGEGRDVGAGLIFGQLHRRLCAEALADLADLEVLSVELPQPAEVTSEVDALFDVVLSQLREVIVPRLTDPLGARRAKGLARILKYLAEEARLGPACRADELDDLAAVLGSRPASVEAGRRQLSEAYLAGDVELEPAFRVTYRRVMRDEHLLASASGGLGGRHYLDADLLR